MKPLAGRMEMIKITGFLSAMMAMLFVLIMGCVIDLAPEFGEMTDDRDGQIYQTVTLGDQTWLAENLNYETDNSWCYDEDPDNCDTFGRLYDWEAAMTACPDGWHLASDEEWSSLIKYLDPKADPNATLAESDVAGGLLKATGTVEDGTGLWRRPNKDASNTSGFSAVPSGTRFASGSFNMVGQHVMFWTSTEYDTDNAWTRMLDYNQSGIFRDNTAITKDYAIAVRCVVD
jgi:uncharacterized protein (TIGR02145 family)